MRARLTSRSATPIVASLPARTVLPLEFVGAVHGSIARPRRLLQRRKRVVDVVIAADLIERRDDATDHKPDQIEHRITDAQDARAAPLRLALGLLQTRLRRVVVRILLGADAALVFRSHSVEVDHAVRRAHLARLLNQEQAGRRCRRCCLILVGVQGQVRDERHRRAADPLEARG